MASEIPIQLTQASDDEIFTVGEDDIVEVITDTLGAKVVWTDEKDGYRRSKVVSETPTQIQGISKVLIKVTDDDSNDRWINNERIQEMGDRPDGEAGTRLFYDFEGTHPKAVDVATTRTGITKAVYDLLGYGNYDIDSVNVTANQITLVAAAGDVTAKFTDGDNFYITGSTANDATYTVSSSTTAGGQTVITTDEDISDGTGDGSVFVNS